jgi:isoamylase
VISFHGTKLADPDFSHHSHSLAFQLKNEDYGTQLFIIVNMYWEPLTFELPPLAKKMIPRWLRIIDTGLPTPEDVCEPSHAPRVPNFHYEAQDRSVVILLGLSKKLSKQIFQESSLRLDLKE